ncbi:MAG TPA: TIGR03086 family metal-binding protein [Pseudonocardia sp.]|nr:TIGR03086 family metal-binding protein [Pseudonocardia sp.]
MNMIDLRSLHSRSLDVVTPLLTPVTGDQLGHSTPCADWTLRQLLEHMIGQNYGFASAVDSPADVPLAAFAPRPLTGSVVTDWEESARNIRTAFADADLRRAVLLPEVSAEQRIPTGLVVGFHLLDTVVHAWDVATTLGVTFEPDAELVAATLRIAEAVPDGPEVRGPGAAFAPRLETEASDEWSRALTLVGRTPRSARATPVA